VISHIICAKLLLLPRPYRTCIQLHLGKKRLLEADNDCDQRPATPFFRLEAAAAVAAAPQNFYTAPYLERRQEESSPIGINGHTVQASMQLKADSTVRKAVDKTFLPTTLDSHSYTQVVTTTALLLSKITLK
jgi:hypothetical protein